MKLADMNMRHMVETHWTEQRSEDQIDYLDDDPEQSALGD